MVSMNWAYALRDLKQQKTRTAFAISGIAVSIFLLTVVGMLGDSISYSYVDYASQSAGKTDYEISQAKTQVKSAQGAEESAWANYVSASNRLKNLL